MDAMVDIETLSTRNNAVVLSVGAVLFDNRGLRRGGFYTEISKKSQTMKGRHVCDQTIDWWKSQPIKPPNGNTPPQEAVHKLNDYCKEAENVWFRGPHFDHVILQSLAEDYGLQLAWKFYQVRDSRTLDIFGIRREKEGNTPHHALSDATEQARDVIYILKELRK